MVQLLIMREITRKNGSFFFIAELIIELELEADTPIKDYCGTCTKCIDACPTDAIVEPYVVDGTKCISYLTIELKDKILPSIFTCCGRSYIGSSSFWLNHYKEKK